MCFVVEAIFSFPMATSFTVGDSPEYGWESEVRLQYGQNRRQRVRWQHALLQGAIPRDATTCTRYDVLRCRSHRHPGVAPGSHGRVASQEYWPDQEAGHQERHGCHSQGDTLLQRLG